MFIQIEDKDGVKHLVNIDKIEFVKELNDGTAEINFTPDYIYTKDKYKMVIADILRIARNFKYTGGNK